MFIYCLYIVYILFRYCLYIVYILFIYCLYIVCANQQPHHSPQLNTRMMTSRAVYAASQVHRCGLVAGRCSWSSALSLWDLWPRFALADQWPATMVDQCQPPFMGKHHEASASRWWSASNYLPYTAPAIAAWLRWFEGSGIILHTIPGSATTRCLMAHSTQQATVGKSSESTQSTCASM